MADAAGKVMRRSTRRSAGSCNSGTRGTPTGVRVSSSPFSAEETDNSTNCAPVAVTSSTFQAGRMSSTAFETKRDSVKGRQKGSVRKTSRTVFPPPSKHGSKRPMTTLTAQFKYVTKLLPAKLDKLESNKTICHAARNREIEDLEEDLIKRIGVVGGLNCKEEKEVTQNKQQDVLDRMTSLLEELQELVETRKNELEVVRTTLPGKICCPGCAEEEK